MKKNLFLLAFALVHFALSAAPVDPKTAQTVAENFFRYARQIEGASVTPLLAAANTENQENWYIFNLDKKTGFVIVSADDRFEPILGYSMESRFAATALPSNVAAWLEGLESEMNYYLDADIQADAATAQRWAALRKGTVAPMGAEGGVSALVQSKWGQSGVFNKKCPLASGQRALTGCVATAMGQIMRYWKYPATGNSSYSYTQSPYGTISANFGTATYDWNAMPLVPNASGTYDALATLLYHAGVGVKMNYGPQSSGAWVANSYCPPGTTQTAENALKNYFRYDATTVSGKVRSNFTATNWANLLKGELNAARPILYAGDGGPNTGHAFVCDGYDDYGKFHFNWGWNGQYDGYFALTTMNPGGQTAFVNNHHVVVGIKPLSTACSVPTSLSSSAVTTNSAVLNWAPVSEATQYYVQARPSSSSTWTIAGYVTTAGASLSNLSASTAYVWQVRTQCGNGASQFSGLMSFTTLSGGGSAPANDFTCNATTLYPSSSCSYASGSKVGATPSVGGYTCDTYAPRDVWYKCAIPSSGYVTFRTWAGSLTDGVMAVYWGSSCSSLISIVCEDDNSNGNNSQMPVIAIVGSPGTMLWVRVWGYEDVVGSFKICALNYNSADYDGQVVYLNDTGGTPASFDEPVLSNLSKHVGESADNEAIASREQAASALAASVGNVMPNPSSGMAALPYSLSEGGAVHIQVFDAMGRSVLEQHMEQAPGSHQADLNLSTLNTGTYFVRFQSGDSVRVQRLEVLR